MCAFKNTLVLLMVCFLSCNKVKTTIVVEQQNQIDLSVTKTTENKLDKIITKDTIGVVLTKEMAFNEKQFFGKLNKKYQIFKEDIEEEIIVLGKEGTKVSIPKNSLSYINLEKPVEGEVTIYLNEYYQKGDMLLGNLTTETKDGLLESAGMINIEVYANGNRCQLKEGENIKVELPTKNKEEGFELFLGKYDQNNKMVWELDKDDFSEDIVDDVQEFEAINLYSDTIQGFDIGKYDELKKGIKKRHVITWVSTSYPFKIRLTFKDTIFDSQQFLRRKYIERELIYSLMDADCRLKKNDDRQSAKIEFDVKEDKKIINLKVSSKNNCYKSFLEEYLSTLNTNKILFTRENYELLFYLEYNEVSQTTTIAKPRNKKVEKRKFENSVAQKGLQSKSAKEVINYVLNSTSLGWINCDRFYRYTGPKDDLIVWKNGEGSYNIKLVFNDINAVMRGRNKGGYVIFENLPRGKKAKLVSVKNKDSLTYWSSKNITISQRKITDLAYEKVALEDLRKEIKKLNKS